MKTAKVIAIASLSIVIAGCSSPKDANKENFSKAIQTFLDTQSGLCASIPSQNLPFTLANNDALTQSAKKRADALVDAGLLSKKATMAKAVFGNKMNPATEYHISEKGQQYFVPNSAKLLGRQSAFCTGKYTVVDVDNFTEPSDVMGYKVSHVNFSYRVKDAADWSQSEGLRSEYRHFADHAQGNAKSESTLILTNEGWTHERLFKR